MPSSDTDDELTVTPPRDPPPASARRLGPLLAHNLYSSSSTSAAAAVSNRHHRTDGGGNSNLVLRRGVSSTLSFGAASSPAAVHVVSTVTAETRDALWSPEAASDDGPGGRRNERSLVRYFVEGERQRQREGGNDTAAPLAAAPPPASPSAVNTCCICLDEIQPVTTSERRTHTLRCPQCTMRAHSKCLARWFAAHAASERLRNAPPNSQVLSTCIPKSTASCPSCRCELDWDVLAIQARRKRLPLGNLLARNQDAGFTRPKPPAAARRGGAGSMGGGGGGGRLDGDGDGDGTDGAGHPASQMGGAANADGGFILRGDRGRGAFQRRRWRTSGGDGGGGGALGSARSHATSSALVDEFSALPMLSSQPGGLTIDC